MKKNKIELNINKNQPLGLLISYEGLSQIVESQLIEHADFLSKNKYKNQVWILCGTKEIYQKSKIALDEIQNKHISEILLIKSFSHNIPFSPLLNGLLLLKKIRSQNLNITWIHARTEYIAETVLNLKYFLNLKLIYDVRGDTYSEIIAGTKYKHIISKPLHIVKAILTKKRHLKSLKHADHITFVSEELKKISKHYLKKKEASVIPCLANRDIFYFDETIRKVTRKQLGYDENQIILGYLGSANHYQCVDETIKYISSMLDSNEFFRLLIISKDKNAFISKIPNHLLSKTTIISSTHEKVNNYLNVIDYAFLLREKNLLNWVSSPIKFAEYSMAGIRVITTNAISQVIENNHFLKNCTFISLENFFAPFEIKKNQINDIARHEISSIANDIYSRKKYIKDYNEIYKA